MVACYITLHQYNNPQIHLEHFQLVIILTVGDYTSFWKILYRYQVTVPHFPHSSYCSPCSGTVCEHYHSEWPFHLEHLEDTEFPSAHPVKHLDTALATWQNFLRRISLRSRLYPWIQNLIERGQTYGCEKDVGSPSLSFLG